MPHASSYEAILPFGKYKGFSLGYLAETHPKYLDSMVMMFAIPDWWREAAARTMLNEPVTLPKIEKPSVVIPSKDAIVFFTYGDNKAGVMFPHDLEVTARFKIEVDAAQWDYDGGYWKVPQAQLKRAIQFFGGPQKAKIDDGIKKLVVEEDRRRKVLDEIRERDVSKLTIPTLIPLFPRQIVAVEFIDRAGGRAMCADDVGMGKTPIGVGFAVLKDDKTLVVCRKKEKIQWSREIKRFSGVEACIWEGDGPQGNIDSQFHIINYDIVEKHRFTLAEQKFDNLTCDEATALKNYKANRTKSLMGYWQERKHYPGIKTKHLVFLTATPILNRPAEHFTLLKFLDSTRFNNHMSFVSKYGTGKDGDDYRNLDVLHDLAKDVVIRREKRQGEPIPANELLIDLTKAEYDTYLKAELRILKKSMTGKISAANMPEIRHMLFKIKFERLIDHIDSMLESGRGVLIFAIHPAHCYEIQKHYGDRCRVVTGDQTGQQAQQAVDDLKAKKAPIGAFTIVAGGMGIDGLQHAMNDVIFIDRWWVPQLHHQAKGRLDRHGQTLPVTETYMVCNGTYDEDMREVHREKNEVYDAVVRGKSTKYNKAQVEKIMDSSVMTEVLNRMKARHPNLKGEIAADEENLP